MIDGLELFPRRPRTVHHFTLSEFQPNMRKRREQVLFGGVVRSIAQHPGDATEFTVATAFGGLFRSNDKGYTWRHLDDLPSDSTNDVVYDRNNPSILLATTHEDFRNPPTGGVWRSTDGGETWRQPESGRLQRAWSSIARLSAFKIAFDPSRAGRVYVATNGGILISDDLGANWQPPVVPGGGDTRFVAVLALASGDVVAGGTSGVWHSSDAGLTWIRTLTNDMQPNDMNGFGASAIFDFQAFVVTQELRLYESRDGGRNWTHLETPPSHGSGPGGTAFVKAVRTPIGVFPDDGSGRQWLRLYYGDRFTTYRKDAANTSGSPDKFDYSAGSWVEESPCHKDTHDLVLDDRGWPILMATDAGLEAPIGPNAVCGGTWVPIGGAQNGLSALQVVDVAGQLPLLGGGEINEYHLYMATMHDHIWASHNNGASWDYQDGPEGGGFQMYPRVERSHSVITYSRCAPCWNEKAGPLFWDSEMWRGPNPRQYGTPVLVPYRPDGPGAGNYIQHGFSGPFADPTALYLFATEDSGSLWKIVGQISGTFAGGPRVVGYEDPVVYQGIKIPGTPPEYVLAQISQSFPVWGRVRPRVVFPSMFFAESCGVLVGRPSRRVNLAYFAKDFDWYPVFAADPGDPNHLIGVDANSQKMVESMNGGTCWQPMEALTQLVTGFGQYHLTIHLDPGAGDEGIRNSLVTLMSFNPASPEQVIIGTEQNGMFFSNDSGQNWVSIPNSRQVTSAKAVHWQSDDTIIVASYGRGLWKLQWTMITEMEPLLDDLCNVIECFVIELSPLNPMPVTSPSFDELSTLTSVTLASASFDEAVLIYNGRLVDVQLIGDQVSIIQTTPGTSHLFATPNGEPKTLSRSLVKQDGNIDGQPQWEPLRRMGKEQVPLGLLLEYGKVKYIFAARRAIDLEPLPQPKLKKIRGRNRERIAKKPSLSLFGGAMFLGYPKFDKEGEELSLVGRGFKPGLPIVLYLDDQKILGQVPVDEKGSFRHSVRVDFPLGKHTVCASQQLGKKRFRSDAAFFIVKPEDDFE